MSKTHFFYATASGPRGFPLAHAVFTFTYDQPPRVPSRASILARLQHSNLSPAEQDAEVARRIAQAQALMPAAQEAYHQLPYKVLISIPGLIETHELCYSDVVRFARAMKLYKVCSACNEWRLMLDTDLEVCSECGYRSCDLD